MPQPSNPLHRGLCLAKTTQVRLRQLLQSRFSHSLARLEYFVEPDEISGGIGFDQILPQASLQSLGLTVRSNIPNIALHSAFIHVTTLCIDLASTIYELPSTWTFPSLLNLTILELTDPDEEGIIPFLKRHGQTLHFLFIRTIAAVGGLVPTIISSIPSLRSLAFGEGDLAN